MILITTLRSTILMTNGDDLNYDSRGDDEDINSNPNYDTDNQLNKINKYIL